MTDNRPDLDVNGEHLDDELLSAYLDDLVEEDETRHVIAEHLSSCAVCRERLAELRLVVDALSLLPEPGLPRSFRLTPEMVAASRDRDVPEPWYLRLQPALRRATAIAAVLLVLVLGVDLLVHQSDAGSSNGSSAPTAQTVMSAAGSSAGSTTSTSSSGGSAAGAENATGAGSSAAEDSAQAGTKAGQERLQQHAATPAGASTPETTSGSSGPAATPAAGESVQEGAQPSPPAADVSRFDALLTGESANAASGPSPWAVAELGLALLVTWLLFMTAVMPRLRQPRP